MKRHAGALALVIGAPLLVATALHVHGAGIARERLQATRDQVVVQMPHPGPLPPSPDARWYGMDLRLVPVDRVTKIIPPYLGDYRTDTTVNHGDMEAPGGLPKPPQTPSVLDPQGYQLGRIGPWDTVYYSEAGGHLGGIIGMRGPSLMLNAVDVGRSHAEAMVRQAGAGVIRRFHLAGSYAPHRERWGDFGMQIRFSRTRDGADPYSPDIQAIFLEAGHTGNAFMAIIMQPAQRDVGSQRQPS